MAEYIEREAALEICEKEYQERLRMLDYCGDTVSWNIGNAIKSISAADVAPVRHGRIVETIENEKIKRISSCCGTDFTTLTLLYNPSYCPHCGALLDEDGKL